MARRVDHHAGIAKVAVGGAADGDDAARFGDHGIGLEQWRLELPRQQQPDAADHQLADLLLRSGGQGHRFNLPSIA
jgi:hypothetical protein